MKTVSIACIIIIMSFIHLCLYSVELQIGYNYNVIGQYTDFYDAPDGEYNRMDNGHSYSLQIMAPVKRAKLGIGAEYQSYRQPHVPTCFPWSGSSCFQIRFIPIYLVVQFPVNTGKTIFEPVAEFGYSIFDGNNDYADYLYHVDQQNSQSKSGILAADEKGFGSGLHAGIGYRIRSGVFAFNMIYKVDNGYFDFSYSRRIFINTSRLGVGVSLNFNVSGKHQKQPNVSVNKDPAHRR